MSVEPLQIFCFYDKQRFTQYGSMDCANWYPIPVDSGKKKVALYPAMGRQHLSSNGVNQLIFNSEPRLIFKSINYFYVVDGTQIFQYDKFFNQKTMPIGISLTGNIWYSILTVQTLVYIVLTDGTNIYIITEDGTSVTMGIVIDPNAPGGGNNPGSPAFVATFGNRIVISTLNTPQFTVSQVNLGGSVLDLNTCFTINGSSLINQASGIIRQFGVLHNQLYIFNDFTTDVWSNTAVSIDVGGGPFFFPYKLNTSYNFDYGMEDPFSLSISFGRMCWLGQNEDGFVSFLVSDGGRPQDFSTEAINVLLQNSHERGVVSPFLTQTVHGFIYQYENTMFYRAVVGSFIDEDILDLNDETVAIEYNFGSKSWARVIELNGERNRIQQHVYFNNVHLVTVEDDTAIYEMAGNIYTNELRTANTGPQDPNAFTQYPFRYELVTPAIFNEDYSEFIDDYVQIDFVFGDQAFYKSDSPFQNAVFIVGEGSTPTNPIYIITEDGKYLIEEGTNYPTNDDLHWNALYKPHIELYISDDGGITFLSADVREPWQLGQYQWIMRWNELGTSRNRRYKLVCVSPAPIVILGAVRNSRRASGGAN